MRRFLKWLLAGFEPFNPPTPLGVLEAPTEPLPDLTGYCEVIHVTTTDGVNWAADCLTPEGFYLREPLSFIEAAYTVAALESGVPVSLKPLDIDGEQLA